MFAQTMRDRVEAIQESEMRFLPVRRLVHGLRYRIDLHLPLLAPSRLRRDTDSVRRRLCHQPYFRDIRLLLQFQANPSDRPREGSSIM